MKNPDDPAFRLRALIDRLARVVSAEEWQADLNPAQSAALTYLAQANRFSRAPSQVADYLNATRGTVSQTLKALQRKGLLREDRDPADGRRVSCTVTPEGLALLQRPRISDDAVNSLTEAQTAALEDGIATLLRNMLAQRGGRSFGVCHSCAHHRRDGQARRCALLEVDLTAQDSNMICHEHIPADPARAADSPLAN